MFNDFSIIVTDLVTLYFFCKYYRFFLDIQQIFLTKGNDFFKIKNHFLGLILFEMKNTFFYGNKCLNQMMN